MRHTGMQCYDQGSKAVQTVLFKGTKVNKHNLKIIHIRKAIVL